MRIKDGLEQKQARFWARWCGLTFSLFILVPACVPKSELAAAKEKTRECMEVKDSLLKVNKELKNENASLKRMNEKLRKPDSVKKEIATLNATIDSLTSRNQTLGDSVEVLREMMKSQRKDLGEVYEEHQRMKSIICSW
ncbi:MAG: hypothetical protein ABEH38_07865 [Flavobacteriales bacterium]